MKCVHCGKTGHLAWDCYSLTPADRGEYRAWQSTHGSDEFSVGSNASSRSEASHASIRSESSRSASGKERGSSRRATPPWKNRRSVFEMSNFAFSVGGRLASFN